LRNTAGKSLICFLAAQIVVIISMEISMEFRVFHPTILEVAEEVFTIGIVMTFMWMSVLAFDIWWTFK